MPVYEYPLAFHVGPLLSALPFIIVMSLLPPKLRQQLNSLLISGAGSAYLSGGGFGVWELPFVFIMTGIGLLGLKNIRWVGMGWLLHSVWDVLHHAYGNPIWPFMPSSSWGCMIFDAAIAIWFLIGAPSILSFMYKRKHAEVGR
ncbi:DUF6010 family protein [Hahella sp. CR1]|uniref:DUF6010 family protein n=1 Tax=Hahella sp. CR1 TaxID=2992807 RepID=UPI002441F0A7|nr:DUF6010 family protein [Hahella sp. CR1]MDG9669526.1 DUF6010 family protein [Hahella sp. CR1]